VVDFFGHPIEVGDRYFYGSPPTFGRVIVVRVTSIMLETGADKWDKTSTTMNCKSPEKGVCLDKVETDE
jgi:hypothetical protein